MDRHGLTIPEVLVAIVMLTVGLLGLAASGLHVSALVGQGSRTGLATTFGVRRLELLRAAACRGTPPAGGQEELRRGGAILAVNTWTAAVAENDVAIQVITRYALTPRRVRADTLATLVVCR